MGRTPQKDTRCRHYHGELMCELKLGHSGLHRRGAVEWAYVHPLRTHGLTVGGNHGRHPLYTLWASVKRRCFDRSYQHFECYGGRGITMFSEWIDRPDLFVDYIESTIGQRPSKSHSIDRIDCNGNYEPGNLRWATQSEQTRNSRMTPRKLKAAIANAAKGREVKRRKYGQSS